MDATQSNVIGYNMNNTNDNTTLIGSGGRPHLIAGSDASSKSYIKTDSQIVGTETFATSGDSQARDLVLLNYTDHATQTNLYLDAGNFDQWGTTNWVSGSELLTVPASSLWRYDIDIVGVDTNSNATAGYNIQGLIANAGGTTALKGSPTIITDFEDVAGWDATATADDTNDALLIEVTGTATNTIRWTARVSTTEIGY